MEFTDSGMRVITCYSRCKHLSNHLFYCSRRSQHWVSKASKCHHVSASRFMVLQKFRVTDCQRKFSHELFFLYYSYFSLQYMVDGQVETYATLKDGNFEFIQNATVIYPGHTTTRPPDVVAKYGRLKITNIS